MQNNSIIDLSKTTPLEIFQRGQDPASGWPGAPPNLGQDVVPHIFTVSGMTGLAARAYLNADEAIRHSRVNAERMRVDCGIMECLGARQRATALLNWHIEAEDNESQEAKDLTKEMSKVLKRTPRFLEMRRNLLEAVWYGRYGAATQYGSIDVSGNRRLSCVRWEPRHGDKLVFRYDDGTGQYPVGQVGVRIGMAGLSSQKTLSKLRREQISPSDQSLVYWLNQFERKLLIVHKHEVEDGTFEDPMTSGRIHGVGIRSRIYWTWYAMVECLQRGLEYLDRSAFGVEIWRYPMGNPMAERKTKEAAMRQVSGGRAVVFVPVPQGEQGDLYGVEHIEPGLQGFDRLLQVINEYFGHRIKRYILGQTLTSEAEATGMGSGVADAHLATFADIVAYDARNLEETLTEDFLRIVQLMNFPQSNHIYLKFVIDTESPNVKEKMEAYKSAWDMGLKIKASDVADVIGASLPTAEELAIFNPPVVQGILAAQGGGAGPIAPMPGQQPLQPSSPQQVAGLLTSAMQQHANLSI